MNRPTLERPSIGTPHYQLPSADPFSVYDPAEDTFVLLDALEADRQAIVQLDPLLCVEIGCGTGVPAAFVAKILAAGNGGAAKCVFLTTDLNPAAAACARATVSEHNGDSAYGCDPVVCDLLAPFAARMRTANVDLVLFNPPYVPTELAPGEEEQRHGTIARAWAGGSDCGVGLVVPLLSRLHEVLSIGGVMYLVAVEQNGIDRLLNVDPVHLSSCVVLQRRAGIEHLFVLKYVRVK